MSLLLLHGALGSHFQLASLQHRISGVAIDLTGHGSRAHEHAHMRFEAFVTDIENAYADQGWESADLFGYSMGGYAALLFAAKHPERVRSVVTLGTKYLWTPEGLQKELRMLDPERMHEKVPAFAQALADVHGVDNWKDVVHAVARNMGALAEAPLLSAEVCERITCPVLLCVGEGDTTAVPEDTRHFSLGLPKAEVQVIPGAKHPMESVNMDKLTGYLLHFWQARDPAARP